MKGKHLSKSVQNNVKDPKVQKAIQKGLKYLNEKPVKAAKLNSLMSKLLARRPHRDLHLNERLSRYLAEGVVERNGFVLLKTEMASAGNYSPPAHFDETGYECLVNHIHIDPKNPDDTSQLDQGFTFANRLAELLQGSGYQGRFRIILSYGLDDKVCTVRFHRVREGQSWLDDNIEAYKRDGILVFDC